MASARWRAIAPFAGLALAVVGLDQLVKLLIKLTMTPGESIPVLGSVFSIHFIENPGAAFGLTLNNVFGDPLTAKVVLNLFSLVLAGLIAVYLYRIAIIKTGLRLWLALILGGAIGNLIDRIFYGAWFAEMNDYEGGFFFGRVVDMFYLNLYNGRLPANWPLVGDTYLTLWPVFNIADAAISVSIVAVLIFRRRLFRPLEQAKAQGPPTDAASA